MAPRKQVETTAGKLEVYERSIQFAGRNVFLKGMSTIDIDNIVVPKMKDLIEQVYEYGRQSKIAEFKIAFKECKKVLEL